MSYIVRGKCHQCGCTGYKKDIDGDNCYTCGHVVEQHKVEYKPPSQPRDVSETTVYLSREQTLSEDFPQGHPDICFQETLACASSSKGPAAESELPPKKRDEKSSSFSSSVDVQSSSNNNSMASTPPTSPSLKPAELGSVSQKRKRKYTPGKSTPRENIFPGTAPYNGLRSTCWRLMMSHLPYSMEPPDSMMGAYKIAENGRTIYVGSVKKVPIAKMLKKHFMGKDKQHIGAYLSVLKEHQREKDITLYWVDESEDDHKTKCGCTFLKCFERMEGKKPRLNMAGRRPDQTAQ